MRKRYAGVEAVKGISFHVKRGEIVGFLGPNGAGKSTTMRILTGYLPATSGDVRIAGHDLLNESLQVRRKTGYMPENVPLYPEMRVREFLEYRAALKGLDRRKTRSRVPLVMEKCGVDSVSAKMIGNLSRGYRQRVGLADALVHDPELLILDEPTAGLDPNQIRSVRDLIKSLGKEHTILLSTHILPEVEMICDRAVIINRGRIEASDTLENLAKMVHTASLFLEVRAEREIAVKKIKELAPVSDVQVHAEADGWLTLECLARPGEDAREAADQLVKNEKWPLREFRRGKATLEDVFVELTQQ
ncbi:MAG: ATP-binding cassette domain-containing protein [Candidatus Methylacidiphilales bacterium]|nr:ATP-binding cassette domain-containing protein [Candidatus Methylacidiphilales bacterium]